jgi:geranylgeranyl reductase family protein
MNELPALVVGAGPAGSIAALALVRAGVRVRILDRATFPRDKLCGDTVNPGSLALLDRLGLGHVRRLMRPITGMTVTGPGGARAAADYPRGLTAGAILRRDFDQALLAAAVAAGAEFVPAAHVRGPVVIEGRVTGVVVRQGGRESDMRARVVIAADGRASRLGAALGLTSFAHAPRRWAFGAYFADVEGLSSHGEMHIRPTGYVGVAPIGEGMTNVCVVHEQRGTACSDAIRPDERIADAIGRDTALRDRFAHAKQISPAVTLGPLAVDARAAGCPGLLLAGDAAGFVDPMTGDGLRFALRGGELAAEAALLELESGAPAHGRLGRLRSREFSGKWRVNRALRSLVGSPRAVRVAAGLTSIWQAPVCMLVGIAGDVSLARQC